MEGGRYDDGDDYEFKRSMFRSSKVKTQARDIRRTRDPEEVNVELCRPDRVSLFVESKTTSEECSAHDEETIRQNRTEHRRPHDVEFPFDEREDGDNQLDGVTECRIEESTESVSNAESEFFSSESEESGQRNDGEE
jgi:hypothetical protein